MNRGVRIDKIRVGITLAAISLVAAILAIRPHGRSGGHIVPNLAGFADPGGVVRTYNENGAIDLNSVFFQSLGANGRSCGTCHQPSDAMSVSAAHIQEHFDDSHGLDPIFRTNDGSNCDHNVDTSTEAGRSAAYSLLRTRGLIRVHLPLPPVRDFEVIRVSNPYGCGETNVISMYRRPLPAANLKFVNMVMWDGRESSRESSAMDTGTALITPEHHQESLRNYLAHQTLDATTGHAQAAAPPTPTQQHALVTFEMGLYSAQAESEIAGDLAARGADGGPEPLSRLPFFKPASPTSGSPVFLTFREWQGLRAGRGSVARGEAIFNHRTFRIRGVAGLEGVTGDRSDPATIVATCGLCHDTPNVGNRSTAAPLNIGAADPPGGNNSLDTGYLPVITLCERPALTTCVSTTDPGRAMITGRFSDVGKFKVPVLRGLSARAPYFHNGSARTLLNVVEFYEDRFQIGFTAQEKADLTAFLGAL